MGALCLKLMAPPADVRIDSPQLQLFAYPEPPPSFQTEAINRSRVVEITTRFTTPVVRETLNRMVQDHNVACASALHSYGLISATSVVVVNCSGISDEELEQITEQPQFVTDVCAETELRFYHQRWMRISRAKNSQNNRKLVSISISCRCSCEE